MGLSKNMVIADESGTYLTKEQLIKEVTKDWDLHEDGNKWFDSGDDGWS
ncbi:MAG: hypothetical protein IMZ52_01180 [Actinobacteria bacterium]|nr:hypothetical protein [Actinomycetota bacterium]MBE3114751.1 hypothetical protein [Actinomycetota bacterium]